MKIWVRIVVEGEAKIARYYNNIEQARDEIGDLFDSLYPIPREQLVELAGRDLEKIIRDT